MPDLPIDTLFIVGLLIASFVGKLLEGRSKNKNTTTKSQKTSKKKGETVEKKPWRYSQRNIWRSH